MKKLFALPRVDGGVEIMEMPPYAVRIGGKTELVLYEAGVLSVLRGTEWLPIDQLSGYELIYASPQQAIAKWPTKRQEEITHSAIKEIQSASIPKDRSYRSAWTATAKGIEHDMAKARDIHREKLRQLRRPILDYLDTAYLRADEAGDATAKADIAAQKQALRDVTADPAIEAAQTIEDLKAVKLIA